MTTFDPIFTSRRMRRGRGFTLLETVAVIAVIMILISLLLPGIQQARETARDLICRNNLTQLGVALHNYARGHGCLPPGAVGHPGKTPAEENEDRLSWIVQILPYLDQRPLYSQIDHDRPDVGPDPLIEMSAPDTMSPLSRMDRFSADPSLQLSNRMIDEPDQDPDAVTLAWMIHPELLVCPSSSLGAGPAGTPGRTYYAGCHSGTAVPISDDNSGLLYLNSSQSMDEIPDGKSQTILVGEVHPFLMGRTWMSGTRSTLRNTGVPVSRAGSRKVASDYVMPQASEEDTEAGLLALRMQWREREQGFDGPHYLHVNFLFADGSVRPIRRIVDLQVYSWLGSRNDLQSLPPDF